jgi:uncharacterized protein HemX
MSSKLKVGVVTVVLLGMAAVLFFQQQQIRRLMEENAGLRTQLDQMASLRDSNGHLADELKATVERSQASGNELTRLRGQAGECPSQSAASAIRAADATAASSGCFL